MAHGKKTVRSQGRRLRRICGGLLLLFLLPVACNVMSRGHVTTRWQDASHDPTGQAPDRFALSGDGAPDPILLLVIERQSEGIADVANARFMTSVSAGLRACSWASPGVGPTP